ncbi:1,2-dihydroxy-3-keto-5-methylthiopentene dioxygenase [Nodosilinea sp. PGN35]|uniref:1,2-dihydroxy-3-keto-5-methylthiopentene dioxygenase n=1 Tax=Nodosilinea sp. PGN35 TaxID=3020489 RepID=UPI0023B2356C|nr:cupin domain-containing protein [Nodosilinea sp. TSF1-S3]MDF0366309.1 cupin domain-containing protein [Nodosilinea sp. TSF1-S3]
MAKIRLENGLTLTDLPSITATLAPLGIQLHHWPIGENAELRSLLAQESLDGSEKETVLTGLDHYFQRLQASDGYKNRDLIVLNPNVPNLDALLAKFDKIHSHADNEIRYIVDGEGVFGFVLPDESQVELTIEPEEYINVPAGTEHWFVLTKSRRIKAVRYFIGTDGWVPEYTGREIRVQPVAA